VPGCGDYAVLTALDARLRPAQPGPENIAIASGIGCSSRFPAFLNTYGIHGIHGRALPLATGIKLGRPETTVVAVGGDGDGFSIGGGHIPHAARRNIDLTYIVMDNSIYGMTKGQPSPTSPQGITNKAAPYGAQEQPLNPLLMALGYDVSFVARCFSGKVKEMVELSSTGPAASGLLPSSRCSARASPTTTPTRTTARSPSPSPQTTTPPIAWRRWPGPWRRRSSTSVSSTATRTAFPTAGASQTIQKRAPQTTLDEIFARLKR
jgi:hypothetical protein